MRGKKILAGVISMALAATVACGLAGCGHQHTYAEQWSTNTKGHWHAATCEHTKLIHDYAEHTFSEGHCSVCQYPDPTYDPGPGDVGGGDIGGTPSTDVVLVYSLDSSWSAPVEKGFTEMTEDYAGRHFVLTLDLSEGTEFYLYENLSGNETVYCNYGAFQSGNDIFNASEANDYGTKNFIVRQTKSYTFDFYVGTEYDGQPQPAHFDAKATDGSDTPGGGGSPVVPGEGEPITVHWHNTKSWTTIGVYAFIKVSESSSTELLGTWPGTTSGVNNEGDGWVSYTFNAPVGHVGVDLYIIFNTGVKDGASQTTDVLVTSAECWVAKNDTAYESKDAAIAAENNAQEIEYTIYFLNTGNWGKVMIHTWGCYATGAWNTVEMTAASELGANWFKFTFTSYESTVKGKELSVIIFNSSSDQSRVTCASDNNHPIKMDATEYYMRGDADGKYFATQADADSQANPLALYAALPVIDKSYLGV